MPAVAPRNMGVLPWFEVGTTFITLSRHCCSEGPADCGCCSYDDIPPPENTEVKGSSVYSFTNTIFPLAFVDVLLN